MIDNISVNKIGIEHAEEWYLPTLHIV